MNRFISGVTVAIILVIAAFFFVIPVEAYILENYFDVLSIVDQNIWLVNFRDLGLKCLLVALVITALWNIIGYFGYYISDWKKAGGRNVWSALAGLLLIAIVLTGYIFTLETQDIGRYLATLIYAVNGIIIYWIATVIQSPSPVKFAPIGAIQIRKPNFLRKLLN
jgi:hypothetical protein